MTRLAIHQADIERYNLPPQRIKAADSRAAGFQRRFGLNASTVELDALPAAELRRRVEMAIKEMIDIPAKDRTMLSLVDERPGELAHAASARPGGSKAS